MTTGIIEESIDSRNSLREYIHHDFTSKYAVDEISLKRQREEIEKQQKRVSDELHLRHRKEYIDLWSTNG